MDLSDVSWPEAYRLMYYKNVGVACQKLYEGRMRRKRDSEFSYYSLIPSNVFTDHRNNTTCKFEIEGLHGAPKSIRGQISDDGFQLDLGNCANTTKHMLFATICVSWSSPNSQDDEEGRRGSRNVLNAWKAEGLDGMG